jgi:hypothetical protein
MKIECTKREWALLEPMLWDHVCTSTNYQFPNFHCIARDQNGEIYLDVEGKFIEEKQNEELQSG